MKLKHNLIAFFVFAAVLSAALIASPLFIRRVVTQSIQNAVPGSAVSLATCRFVRGNSLEFGGIRIVLKSPSKNFPQPKLPRSENNLLSFLLASITVTDLQLDIQTSDLSLRGTFSFTRDLRKSTFNNLTIDIPSLALGAVQAKNIRASTDTPGAGEFGVESLSFSKFLVTKLRGRFRVSDAGVLLESMAADLLNGSVKGRLTLTRLDALPVGTAELDLADIPIASFLKLWEWDKKVAADGNLRGHLLVEAQDGKLTRLDGAMLAVSGGSLVILDQAFLENIAARTQQPIEIVKASFEDYHYNTGTVGVSLEENSLRLHLDLEGEKGKRDLEVTLHDWF